MSLMGFSVFRFEFDSWSLNSLGSSEHSVNVSLWDFYEFNLNFYENHKSDQLEKI